jgi:hypothetical protein
MSQAVAEASPSKIGPALAVAVIATACAFAIWSFVKSSTADPDVSAAPAPATSSTPAPVADRSAAAPRPTDPVDQKIVQARVETLFQTLDARFVEDSLDPEWSASAEQLLLDAAAEPALTRFGTPEDYSARCSGHLCKIEMVFADRDQADDWATFYPVEMGLAVSAIRTRSQPLPDGRIAVTMFGARKGSERLVQVAAVDSAATDPDAPGGG